MSVNYPTFQSDPKLNSVSASIASIDQLTASSISASSYLGIPASENATYVGNKVISGSLTVSSSLTVSGNVILGDATTDSITLNAATMSLGGGTGILNIDSNTLYVDGNNNRVGLGKINPNSILDISGNLLITGSLTSSQAVLLDGLYFGNGKYDTINSIAIGYAPLASTTTGVDNVAIGYLSAYNTTIGSRNVSLGSNALYNNINASNNTCVGHFTLYSNKTGTNNVAFGYQTLYSNISGSTNTAIGNNAGLSLGDGPQICSNNTFIGASAGSSVLNVQNSVVIGGNNGSILQGTTGSIIISDGAGNIRIQANNTGAVIIPSGSLTVSGSLIVSGGILFPVTQVASANPNNLDDYEEGTWTPQLSASITTGFTYNTEFQSGSYVKIGRLVNASGRITLSGSQTSTGSIFVSNLPFTIDASNNANTVMPLYFANTNPSYGNNWIGTAVTGTNNVAIFYISAGSALPVSASYLASNTTFIFNINYTTS